MVDVITKVADGIATGQFILCYFKFWGIEQNLIQDVWQMVLAYISVQGWIIDPYI